MELFTEIEFNETEFDKMDEVLFKLGNEGWKLINTNESTKLKHWADPSPKVIAKKFFFTRKI